MELHPARLTARLCAEIDCLKSMLLGFLKANTSSGFGGVQFLPADAFALAQGWKQTTPVLLLLVKRKLILIRNTPVTTASAGHRHPEQ